ncbi:blast:Prothrombin [Mytilus galloprovincialis]|uniref:Blast:Prothrombin n=1 Tax=Mytilus galloprovincialis TaxID=29158 RepID=A0A8B6H6X1_MYTGA|nr:blast:Prothrombin [Mytilus galloprovincialis]
MANICVLRTFVIVIKLMYIHGEICGGILKKSSGYISPPLINNTYQSNSFCRWEIHSNRNNSIILTSTDFSVEESPGCIWDYLDIRDGEDNATFSVGRFCGYDDIYFISESPAVYIYFVTDQLQNYQGFTLQYRETGEEDSSQCNTMISSESYITSPGYPDNYPRSTTCLYRIVTPAQQRVQLNILKMSISDDSCMFDRLEIFDGTTSQSRRLMTLCGTTSLDIMSTGDSLLVIFISDYMLESRGFLAEIKFITEVKENDEQIVENRSTQRCGVKIEGSMKGTITSSGYPDVYDNNINCSMTIIAPLPDHQIMIQFTHMEIEESDNCSFDRVSLFLDSYSDSPEVMLCAQSASDKLYFSRDGLLKIRFTTDNLITWTGFSANYTVIPRQVCYPRCQNNSVCIKDGRNYRCIKGQKCATNLCNHGHCIKKGLADVQCFCHEGYNGLFCTDEMKIEEEKLKFIKTPTDQLIEPGERIILECQVNDDTSDYMWFYEDLMLQTEKNSVTVLPGGVLDIFEFSRTLEGLYKCLASTSSDFLEHEFRLSIVEPCDLSVEVPPMDTVVEESSVVLMSCYSQQAVNVTWYKDAILIADTMKYETLSEGQYLAVSNVVPTDAGEYTCQVTSNDGCHVERSAQLSVIPASGFNSYCARDVLVHNPRVRMVGRITLGSSVDKASAPWHAVLRMRSQDKTFCGANLISSSWLITAAHCIRHFHIEFKEMFAKEKVDIFLGTNSCKGESGVKYGIKSYVVHPKFGARAVYDNDVALIELDRSVTFTENIQPVCLQPSSIINNNYLTHKLGHKIGRVVGCGQYSEFRKAAPEYLREVYVPYVNREDCASVNIGQGNFTDSMFCAGYSRRNMGDACFGDSGGSLTMRLSENHPWVLVGIVSWGVGCDRSNHYGYYTHVAAFENWIQNYTISDRDP